MGNLTYIPKKASEDDIIAFDTGPGNVMIDHFMKKYYNKDYDCLLYTSPSPRDA